MTTPKALTRYDSDEEGVMRESPSGMYVLASDLTSIAAKVKELEHEEGCPARSCLKCGPIHMNRDANHEYEPGQCKCRKGEVLAMCGVKQP